MSEDSRPVLRQFSQDVIAGVKGTRRYETYDETEAKTRFSVTLSHVGMVKLLQEKGGSFDFDISEDAYRELVPKQIGIRMLPGTGRVHLWIMDE